MLDHSFTLYDKYTTFCNTSSLYQNKKILVNLFSYSIHALFYYFFFTLGLGISISESIASGHNEGGTGSNSKRDCGRKKDHECNQGTSVSN